jgi:ribosomal protein S18 acetylase RimI-like enzyme
MLRLMDDRTEWLASQGRTKQWGTERQSDRPDRIEGATKMARSGGTWVAFEKGPSSEQVLGVLAVGDAASYVSPPTEPELYINYLITDPKQGGGRGLGTMLVEKAKALAKEKGVRVIRLDCYAGGDGKLVRWYESQGFQKQEAFEAKGWPGQVLTMWL